MPRLRHAISGQPSTPAGSILVMRDAPHVSCDLDERKIADALPDTALILFAHQAVAEQRPCILFCEEESDKFVETVLASEALVARARAIRDELSDLLGNALVKATGPHSPDPGASLAGSLIASTWTVAFVEAHRTFYSTQSAARAYECFLAIIDQGSKGVNAAVQGMG